MAGATKTTADATLQEDYQPLVREQINNDIPILTYVEKNTKDTDGRRAVLSLHVTRNSGVGNRAEGGTLPTAGYQGFAEERVNLYSIYGRGQLSGQLLKSADSNAAAFERALDGETKRITNDVKRDVNRQVWGTSNGVIAQCALTTSSLGVLLASSASGATGSAIASDVQFRQLEVGMLVDIGTVAAPTLKTSANAIVETYGTGTSADPYRIVLTSVATTTGTDFIFRSGNGGDTTNSTQKEVTGLQSIIDSSGTLHNVNPTTYPVWKSIELSNSGTNRQISETLMAQCVQEINIASGTWPNLAVTHHGVFRAYANTLLGLKRFNNTVSLKGGYAQGIPFIGGGGNEIPVVTDRDCPANSMFFINTDHLTEYMMSDWEFMQEDGAVLNRVANADAYEFVLFKYMEVATDRRNTHGKILDLSAA
jgi:hypothetical protein